MLRRRATRRIVLIAGALVPLLAGHVAALAASPTAAQILDQFNLVSSGGDSSQSDIEGSAVIGGTLSGNGTFFNNDVPASPTVSVYGAVSGTGISLDAGGSLYAPSAPAPGRVNFNGGGTYRGAAVQPLSAYTTPLSTLSGSLAGLSRNSTIVDRNGTATFDAVAGRDGLAVFSLTAFALRRDLTGQSNIRFNIGSGVTGVIVDVKSNFTEPGGLNWNGTPQRDVLFNFSNATKVTVGNWEASVLAPKATVGITGGGALNGTLVAANFTGGGELHNFTYDGALPVPEPGMLPAFGAALAGLALLRRRR